MQATHEGLSASYDAVRSNTGIPVFVLFALFVPGHMFNWLIEWLWLSFQIIFALAWLLLSKSKISPICGIEPRSLISTFLFFSIAGVVGAFYGATVLGIELGFSDVPALLQFTIFAVFAVFIGSIVDYRTAVALAPAFKIVIVLNLACVFILVADIEVASEIVRVIYGDAKIQYQFGHIRIGVPFANPNFAALIFILILSFFLFYQRSGLFATLALVSIFFTGSRSGYVAVTPILLLMYFMVLSRSLTSWWAWALCFLFHVIAFSYADNILVLLQDFSRVVELITALQGGDIFSVETAGIRAEVVNRALEFIALSPFFGIGPGRSLGLHVTDSQLVAWPLMYGIPTGALISGFFALLFLNSAKVAENRLLILSSVFTCLAFFLMMATGDFMKNYRLFFITLLICQCMYKISAHRPSLQ